MWYIGWDGVTSQQLTSHSYKISHAGMLHALLSHVTMSHFCEITTAFGGFCIGSYCLARWSLSCQHLYPALLPLNQATVLPSKASQLVLLRWWSTTLATLVGIGGQYFACLIQGKEGGIQVLAGLAPYSQTVGSSRGAHTSYQRWLL